MDDEGHLKAIWNQKKIPVIFRSGRNSSLQLRMPYAPNNRAWLRCSKKKKDPEWNAEKKFWRLPKSRLNQLVGMMLERFGSVHIIQPYVSTEKCAPACWDARGFECECSCMGENHGKNHHGDGWCVISETCAIRIKSKIYGARLVTKA